MKEIPKPQKEIKNLVFFNRDCCVIYFPIFIFCFGVSNKKLTKKKKKKKTIVWTPEIHLFFIVIIICVHWFPPFFFFGRLASPSFHTSWIFCFWNKLCLPFNTGKREREKHKSHVKSNKNNSFPFLFFFSFWGSKWKSCLVVVIVRSAFVSVSTLSQESPAHTNGAQSSRMMSKEKRQGRRIDQVELLLLLVL